MNALRNWLDSGTAVAGLMFSLAITLAGGGYWLGAIEARINQLESDVSDLGDVKAEIREVRNDLEWIRKRLDQPEMR